MGLMDKVKDQASQLAEKSKQGVAQGQAKLDELQQKKVLDGLYRDLGAATYAAQRGNGSSEEVDKLIQAIDAHQAEHASPSSG
ncbi:MAG TPA: hypothetical protein VEJ87_04465 [Acidimicrobiales bacterium]|nr:hypothetical protein [Acidimicrobiales bacterium]